MKNKKKERGVPCKYCGKPTRRSVKFGYCTFFTPCCAKCSENASVTAVSWS